MDFELKRWKTKYLSALKAHADRSLPDGLPHSAQEAEAYITARLLADDGRELCRAVIIDGKPVGMIEIIAGSGISRRSAAVRFWLAEDFRGKGIMSAALAQMADQAFERLDILRIDAEVPAGSIAARCALNNAGFALEGTLSRRAWINGKAADICVYAMLK